MGDTYLYLSELEGLGEGMPAEDSAMQVQLYTQQWIQDQLLLKDAEGRIKNSEQIERSVQDFRTSLVLNEYEQILVTEQLDSVVTAQELSDYYEANKEQYQSGVEWVRAFFVKAPLNVGNTEELKAWFQAGTRADMEKIRLFCKQHNTPAILDEQFWVRLDRILVELPEGELPRRYMDAGTIFVQTDEQYLYLYKTLEYKGADEATPLSKVREEITRIILHQRRMKLLDENRSNIYEKGKQSGSFEMF